MNCSEESCGGKIDTTKKINLRISCSSFKPAHPCGTCGMVHWEDGQPCVNRSKKKTFLKNERVVVTDDKGSEEDITDHCG